MVWWVVFGCDRIFCGFWGFEWFFAQFLQIYGLTLMPPLLIIPQYYCKEKLGAGRS